MAEETKPKSPGCLTRLMSLFLFAAAIGLAVSLVYAALPQDLSDIDGYEKAPTTEVRDLHEVMQNSLDRGYDLTLSEGELNGWLKKTLSIKQGGLLEKNVQIKGVAVRLEKDLGEVIMERTIFGKPFTVSMFIRIEQLQTAEGVSTMLHRDGGTFFEAIPQIKKGGRFGKLVVPQGLLYLVLPAFSDLRDQFADEISMGFEKMSRVQIGDGQLKLDPRPPEMNQSISPTF